MKMIINEILNILIIQKHKNLKLHKKQLWNSIMEIHNIFWVMGEQFRCNSLKSIIAQNKSIMYKKSFEIIN